MKKLYLQFFIFFIFISITTFSQVKLPKLISDGMVLQRNSDVKIWGWAASNENVSIHFIGSTYQTKADDKGNWDFQISNLKAGGPYKMEINASNSIKINDIMIGDVWVCSGQSNMELPMKRVSWNYPGEIENSENKYIRQFLVPDKYNFDEPQNDLSSGSWMYASPENTPDFSATAYFFAKQLYEKYKVPVGLINSALGGSPVEAWISENTLKEFPKYYNEAKIFRDSILIKITEDYDRARSNAWYNLLHKEDDGFKDPKNIWYDTNLNTSNWSSVTVPGYWANSQVGPVIGSVWFRKKIDIPSYLTDKPALLILGRIKDSDSVFVNGEFIGTTGYEWPPRRYKIPVGLLREDENTITVRIICTSGIGGFVPDKEYKIEWEHNSVNLEGDWKFHLGSEMPILAAQTFIRWKPMGLYNAMIAPLINYSIRGVIWYQGESNAGRPFDYFNLFSAMINDWRNNWNEGNFPFLFVQLPNYMDVKDQPSESGWAMLREAQLQTLSVPNTGMAVTIDIGEWSDIHPLDKKDVGERLFLAAEKVAYDDKDVIYSGPIYQSMKIEGNKIILTFTNIGSGLEAKGDGELKSFSIAGADKQFIWAKAKIEGDNVIVWSDEVSKPIAARYAWADNPVDANLYNKEGLPASPFRTDEF